MSFRYHDNSFDEDEADDEGADVYAVVVSMCVFSDGGVVSLCCGHALYKACV